MSSNTALDALSAIPHGLLKASKRILGESSRGLRRCYNDDIKDKERSQTPRCPQHSADERMSAGLAEDKICQTWKGWCSRHSESGL